MKPEKKTIGIFNKIKAFFIVLFVGSLALDWTIAKMVKEGKASWTNLFSPTVLYYYLKQK